MQSIPNNILIDENIKYFLNNIIITDQQINHPSNSKNSVSLLSPLYNNNYHIKISLHIIIVSDTEIEFYVKINTVEYILLSNRLDIINIIFLIKENINNFIYFHGNKLVFSTFKNSINKLILKYIYE